VGLCRIITSAAIRGELKLLMLKGQRQPRRDEEGTAAAIGGYI